MCFVFLSNLKSKTKLLSSFLIPQSSAWTSLLGGFFPPSLRVLKVLSSSDRPEVGFWANDARRFESCNTRRKRRSLRQNTRNEKNKYKPEWNIVIKDIHQLPCGPKHHNSLLPPVLDRSVANDFPSYLFTFLASLQCITRMLSPRFMLLQLLHDFIVLLWQLHVQSGSFIAAGFWKAWLFTWNQRDLLWKMGRCETLKVVADTLHQIHANGYSP